MVKGGGTALSPCSSVSLEAELNPSADVAAAAQLFDGINDTADGWGVSPPAGCSCHLCDSYRDREMSRGSVVRIHSSIISQNSVL